MSRLKKWILKVLSYLFSRRVSTWLARIFSRKWVDALQGKATDLFAEGLFRGLEVAAYLCRDFRNENLRNFRARYVVVSDDGKVSVTADFDDGNVDVSTEALEDWTVRIRFKDAAAFRSFLLSDDQDVLNSILEDAVEVDGNLNYVYKLGYMAKDLELRLGLA